MRMSLASESRQPCSAFSCIDDIRNRPSGLKSDADVRAGPAQHHRLLLGDARVPERRAAVGGDRQAPAARRRSATSATERSWAKTRAKPASASVDHPRLAAGAEGDQARRPASAAMLSIQRPFASASSCVASRRDQTRRPSSPPVITPSPVGWRTAASTAPSCGACARAALPAHLAVAEREHGLAVGVEQGGGDVGVEVHGASNEKLMAAHSADGGVLPSVRRAEPADPGFSAARTLLPRSSGQWVSPNARPREPTARSD